MHPAPLPLALLLAVLLPATAAAGPVDATPTDALSTDADALYALTNAYRGARGAPPLQRSARLDAEARWFALDMAVHDDPNDDHRDSLGRRLWPRLRSFGVRDPRAAQNWAVGTGDPWTAFTALRLSPDHDLNMRYRPYRTTGVAVAENPGTARRFYWVQTFSVFGDDAPPRVTLRRQGDDPQRPVVFARASAPGRIPRLQVQVRGPGGTWRRSVVRPARWRLRLRAGESARVRAVTAGLMPVRGPWVRVAQPAAWHRRAG